MRVTVSDAKKRRELLEDFLFWFFDSFVIALIKVYRFTILTETADEFQTAFYATETASYRNRVLYFRQDDWKRLCSPLIDKLTTDTYRKIPSVSRDKRPPSSLETCLQDEVKAILAARDFGFSFVRLLPKDSGVRPIVNLRRKSQRLMVSFVRGPSKFIDREVGEPLRFRAIYQPGFGGDFRNPDI